MLQEMIELKVVWLIELLIPAGHNDSVSTVILDALLNSMYYNRESSVDGCEMFFGQNGVHWVSLQTPVQNLREWAFLMEGLELTPGGVS